MSTRRKRSITMDIPNNNHHCNGFNVLILTTVILLSFINFTNAITNTQDQQAQQALASPQISNQPYTHLQFPSYTDQLNRGQLSPQEQSHILSDVQQHRFLVNVGERPRSEPPRTAPAYHQPSFRITPPSQQVVQSPPAHQHLQQSLFSSQQQTFHHQFPQENFQIGNIASTFANSYHANKKPILLQPTYSDDYQPQPQQQPQQQQQQQKQQQQPQQQSPSQQPPQQTFHTSKKQSLYQQHQTFQPSYQLPQQNYQQAQHTFQQPTFQSNFAPLPASSAPQFDNNNNYLIPAVDNNPLSNNHPQYLSEIRQEKPASQYQNDAYTPEPPKNPTQSWVIETQPPTPYKKQKPYDAITFATESYKGATQTPRVVKYRPRPVKQEEKYSQNNGNPSEIYIKPDRKKLYEQLVGGTTKTHSTTQRSVTPKRRVSSTTTTTTTTESAIPDEQYIQQQLQKQIQEQLGDKDDIFKTLKITLPGDLSPDQIANLPSIALGDSVAQVPELPPQLSSLSQLPQSVYLASGQKVKLGSASGKPTRKVAPQVKTIVVNQPTPSTTSTTIKPPTVLFEELTKNVLPPGANYEVIRQNQDGALEEVGNINTLQQKKVTFVILEEQPDGTVKVQGVRGNENIQTDSKETEVDSIIERLKKGEIKLPPSTKLSTSANATPQESQASPNYVKHESKVPVKSTVPPRRRATTTRSPIYLHSTPVVNTHAGPVYSLEDEYHSKRSSTTASPPRNKPEYISPVRNNGPSFLPTISSSQNVANSISIPSYSTQSPPSANYNFSPSPTYNVPSYTPSTVSTTSTPFTLNHVTNHIVDTEHMTTPLPPAFNGQSSSVLASAAVLTDKLRANGLFAMAKFLRQSGLDTVLNETGPYTLFVPTDKAFRALLVQLGGPDRAEIKFKENPRLLSGLLLHHVIPGAFKVDTLLDEMTGVSLAGTQLRVNTYTTQDQEWNDVKVITINGARVLTEKSDIIVPQGVAHSVDRVMFPLPVGDIVQTLMSDREGRFSKFIKLLQETGVAQSLQGTKSYTVFAPTDSAFTEGELERLVDQRGTGRALALRHITPGTLYSAGMLYYQLKDSMNSSNQLQLSKDAGRVKVNNAHVISRNIPATNGVIHAIDSLL